MGRLDAHNIGRNACPRGMTKRTGQYKRRPTPRLLRSALRVSFAMTHYGGGKSGSVLTGHDTSGRSDARSSDSISALRKKHYPKNFSRSSYVKGHVVYNDGNGCKQISHSAAKPQPKADFNHEDTKAQKNTGEKSRSWASKEDTQSRSLCLGAFVVHKYLIPTKRMFAARVRVNSTTPS